MADDAREVFRYIHKTVPFRYSGTELRIHLSHGVFSSHDVDEGSRLLLKTIAQNVDVEQARRVLDVGCGAGVLGLAVAKRHPGLELTAIDRNVFAVAITELNARENDVRCTAMPELGLRAVTPDYDLIISNFPAKAGPPVIQDFLRRVGGYLRPTGRACIVFVTPLADLVDHVLQEDHIEVIYREATKNHFVVHLRGAASELRDPWEAYVRTSGTASYAGFQYEVATVYGLPEFDTLSFRSELLLDALRDAPTRGSLLFANPGQGHVACAVSRSAASPAVFIASDDVLQLAIADRNLAANGVTDVRVETFAHLGELSAHPGVSTAVLSYDPIASADWMAHAAPAIRRIAKSSREVIFGSTSTTCARLEKALRGEEIRVVSSKKYRGQRVLVLRSRR